MRCSGVFSRNTSGNLYWKKPAGSVHRARTQLHAPCSRNARCTTMISSRRICPGIYIAKIDTNFHIKKCRPTISHCSSIICGRNFRINFLMVTSQQNRTHRTLRINPKHRLLKNSCRAHNDILITQIHRMMESHLRNIKQQVINTH